MTAAETDPSEISTGETGTGETGTGQTGTASAVTRGRVQSVQRAIALLDAIATAAPAGAPVAELALACGINRATAWRLLVTLEEQGLVTRDPATSRYQIGYTVARMAAAAGVDGVVRRAHHVLERV
ncbi:MAG: helix-turn-helix domain-containing protein, partial [Nocardiopsaceae bacterium]|nr:helix-turn-helix domain-containing protein [Nocardiopsaceae bacterium]